jgi:RNA polymerase sigma-70 factor, ECF subfamily
MNLSALPSQRFPIPAPVGHGTDEGPRVHDPPDSLLVRSARSGDAAACQELIRRYQDRIYAVAYGYVHDREDALDITQDTFLRMLEGLPRFREEANFYTWLYRIVVNRCIDWRRRRTRRPPPMSFQDMTFAEALEPVEHRAALRPHEALETKELREQIGAAIAAVPEIYRVVVVLADLQGLSSAEIAQILRCPVNTVKTRLHRGRLAIRARLGAYLKGEDHDVS